jgi:hypothetical protein
MTYSFSIKATSKSEAKAAVAAEWDRIATQQPTHATDATVGVATANALIDLMGDDASKDVAVGMYGSINVTTLGELTTTGIGMTANVYLTPRT